MDGVIFDSERAAMRCWLELADKYGIKDMEATFLECTGTTNARTREILIGTYGESFPCDRFAREASEMFHERYDGGRLPMKPGVTGLLDFLKAERKKIGLASSTRRWTVTEQLGAAGILRYFDAVVCGDMVERSKPAPDIYLKACELLETAPGRAYAIEDSYNGIRSARAAGLMPLMVPDLLPPDDEMLRLAAAVPDSLAAVEDYLK